jgi:peptidoglycan hydrolase-like protein with peptidoglycan-binding domain
MSYYSNRYSFWRDHKNSLIKVDKRFSSYMMFESLYMNNEANFWIFYNLCRDQFNFGEELKPFYSIFACDMEWAQKTKFCSGPSTTNTNTNTTNTNTNTNTTNTNTNTNKTTNTSSNVVNITTDQVANGDKVIKRGMSGDIVRKIQELLIKHGFTNVSASGKPDGIFGSRTAKSVYDFQEKMGLKTDKIVGENTWAKLISEPTSAPTSTSTGTQIPKLDPNTGLPDNSLGLPKINLDPHRFDKYGVSQAQLDADAKRLNLKNENMKLTDIITGIVQEQGTTIPGVGQKFGDYVLPGFPSQTTPTQANNQSKLTPNQRLAMTKGFGPVSAEYADQLYKTGKLAGGTAPSTKLPSGIPEMPSLKDMLNPPKSNSGLGPVYGKSTTATPSGAAQVADKTTTATPWGAAKAAVAGAQNKTKVVNPKPVQPYSLTDVAKGGYLRFGMKGNVVRDMQVLINSLNVPEIKVDTNGVFNDQTLDAVIKVQKMLGIKPKNGKYGIFGPITIGAINKRKAGTTGATGTGIPSDITKSNNATLPILDTSLEKYKKLGVSPEQQAADLKRLGLNEDLIKKTIKKHLRSL